MKANQSIRVMIVEDHPMYRTGLRMALNYADSGYEVVAEAESVRQAVELLQTKDFGVDLILLDYYLLDGHRCAFQGPKVVKRRGRQCYAHLTRVADCSIVCKGPVGSGNRRCAQP